MKSTMFVAANGNEKLFRVIRRGERIGYVYKTIAGTWKFCLAGSTEPGIRGLTKEDAVQTFLDMEQGRGKTW